MKSFIFITCLLLPFLVHTEETALNIESVVGEWQGFILNKNEITCQTRIRYTFYESGKWSISQEDAKEEQGWYKLHEENRILLQPRSAALKKENSAIIARQLNTCQFIIDNPVDRSLKLLFIKTSYLNPIQISDLRGDWKITQKNLHTEEIKTAPFVLTFHADGTYSVTQEDKVLSKDWSIGQYEIKNNLVYLKNKYSGKGLWSKPVFFWYDKQLNYNNSLYRLWGEPLQKHRHKGVQ